MLMVLMDGAQTASDTQFIGKQCDYVSKAAMVRLIITRTQEHESARLQACSWHLRKM
jgi:hypothetical protein